MSDKKDKKSFLNTLGNAANNLAAQSGKVLAGTVKSAKDIGKKAEELTHKAKDEVVHALDANGSGSVDLEDFIIHGLRAPGVRINRESFLRAELQKDFTQDIIEYAIQHNPAQAGITVEQIDRHAEQVIVYERNCVTGISSALGVPGGVAMVATLPADMIQYYGFMLRAAQKLLYLYGFPAIDVNEKDNVFDSETLNMLTLCLGVMYGVSGANQAIKAVANALATGVEKKLLKAALTKGTIYPMVKKIAHWFGINMTKKIYAGFFKKAIPVVGGVVGGAITFLSFGPCCEKLKDTLRNTKLSNLKNCEDVNIEDLDFDPDDDK